ncbi:hypothetical protein TRVA0_052S00298 [Trichomonascus vanleenenianus]|uniref:uncharacterized protein n=1 Tax=Trichomonascus vanleenenianus TaxID=2268995 RepID=UPI003EC982FA
MFSLARTTVRRGVRYMATEPPIMASVRQSLKEAMRAGDSSRKNVLRAVMGQVKNANLETPDSVTTDIAFFNTVQSMIKKRAKAVEQYKEGNRQDLVDKELAEVKLLEELASSVTMASAEEIEQKLQKLAEEKGFAIEKPHMKKIMAAVPWKTLEADWNAPSKAVVDVINRLTNQKRSFSTIRALNHENPLGLPRSRPNIPRSRPGQQAITKTPIEGVKKVILVSSAKGGVGKSTVAVNLALSLFNQGLSTGILDVDIFGPSIPKLLNLSGEPGLTKDGLLIPKQNYGLKAMSMGFLVDPDKAIAWRGLLVQKALQQLMFEVAWGGLDVLVLDMPPGTGDVQLTLAQQVKVDGAVLVSTPQDIALIDAVRGIDMFNKLNIPVLGMVQNMSVFVCPNCNHETHIFGSDGAMKEAQKRGIDVIGNIPLNADICTLSDSGKPPAAIPGPIADSYGTIAQKVRQKLGLT